MQESAGFKIFLIFVGAAVSAAAGIFGTKFADSILPSTKLIYDVTYSEPFIANNETIQIVRFSASNTGTKLLEDIDINIDPKGRTIDNYQIAGISRQLITEKKDEKGIRAHAQYLNADEQIIVQFLFRADNTVNAKLDVSVRAKGTTGELRSEESKTEGRIGFFTVLPAVLAATVSFLSMGLIARRFLEFGDPQKINMYILYNKFEFPELASQLLQRSHNDVTYAMESEILTNFAKDLPEERVRAAINLHKEIVSLKKVHPSSKAIARINIAILALKINDRNGANEVLEGIGKTTDTLVRLKIESDQQIREMLARV